MAPYRSGEQAPASGKHDYHFQFNGKKKAANPFDPLEQPEEFADWAASFGIEEDEKNFKPEAQKPKHTFNQKNNPRKSRLN